jgi:hypothetical protein
MVIGGGEAPLCPLNIPTTNETRQDVIHHELTSPEGTHTTNCKSVLLLDELLQHHRINKESQK